MSLMGNNPDVVGIYLREIGRVPLLEPHQEIWLSIQQEAVSRIKTLYAGLSEQEGRRPMANEVLDAVLNSLRQAWSALTQNCTCLQIRLPNLARLAGEARAIRHKPMPDIVPYLYHLLQRSGGTESREEDELWVAFTSNLCDVVLLLYILPESILDRVAEEWNGLQRLGERRRRVLELHYGLNGQDRHTLEEIGQRLGITRERVRQIELKAIRALRTPRNWRRFSRFALN
jgi:hypothetical protein